MKLNGGVIGAANQPTNRVASGVWSRYEQYTNVLYNSFPAYFPGYDLTTIQNAQTVYRNISLNINAQDGASGDLYIKPDGTAIYMVGASNDAVYQYNLSTPWDLSTASYPGVNNFVGSQDPIPSGLFFSSDGTRMYIAGDSSNTIYQYSMSPAWNLSQATYSNVFLSVAGQDTDPQSIYFKPDGLILFLVGANRVYQYNLTSAWNLATATYSGTSFSVSAQAASSRSLTFKPDGTKMFVGDNSNGAVYEYNLSSPWDISTAIYSFNNYKTVVSAGTGFINENPLGIAFDSTGTRLYVVGLSTDRIYQIAVGTPYTLLMTPGYAGSVSIAQESISTDVSFSLDGTQMYIVGTASDTVYQYALSIAWDVTTAVYANKSLSVATQETAPNALFFKPDGTKMYVLGTGTDTVHRYGLSTPWDVSTASYDNISRSVVAQTGAPTALFFGNNGLKLYVLSSSCIVYQYALSAAWDLSTVAYETKTFSVLTNSYLNTETSTTGLFFSADGSKMFVMGNATGRIYQYLLAVSWDISTATYAAQINYSYTNYDANKQQLGDGSGIYFKPDGSKMFLIGSTSDRVHQYFLTP